MVIGPAVAAALDGAGALLGVGSFPATSAAYRELHQWLTGFSDLDCHCGLGCGVIEEMVFREVGVGGVTTTVPPRTDAELFEAIYPALRRLAVAVCPPEHDPDDLVQDATARALRRGALVDLDHPAAYLRRTIVNLASNERRRLRRLGRALGRQPDPGAAAVAYPSDVSVLLKLAPGDRAVLWLADVERLDFAEVADLLGCSPDAARTRAVRARARLRPHLQDDA